MKKTCTLKKKNTLSGFGAHRGFCKNLENFYEA